MRHLVTISLVFFSLSHLAKADRVDSLRYLTERYCAKTQTIVTESAVRSVEDLQDIPHFILSNNQLSAIGVLFSKNCSKYNIADQPLLYAAETANPRNNSP